MNSNYYNEYQNEGYQSYSTDQNTPNYYYSTSNYDNYQNIEKSCYAIQDPRKYENYQYVPYTFQETLTYPYTESYTTYPLETRTYSTYPIETKPFSYQSYDYPTPSPLELYRTEPIRKEIRETRETRYDRPNEGTRNPDPNNLHVSGLVENVTIDLLKDVFGKFGKVKSVRLPKDIYTEKHRGYAFVTFEDSETIKKVMKNPPKIEGRDVKIEFAKEGPKKISTKPSNSRFEPYSKELYKEKPQFERKPNMYKPREYDRRREYIKKPSSPYK